MNAKDIVLPCLMFCLLSSARVPCMEGQLETSQVPLDDVLSPEPVKMQMNLPPEGLLHLDVAVTDRDGRHVPGIAAKDFKLLDNGSPRPIVSFAASNQTAGQNERLTEVILVLDEVNLTAAQLDQVENESIKLLRQHGGHLGYPTSIYWSLPKGLYASAAPSKDGDALAAAIAHHTLPRTVWSIQRPDDLFKASPAGWLKRWEHSLRTIYSIALERRSDPGRKLLVWLGRGWPVVPAPQEINGFPYLVELSTRIREARMVVSEITAGGEPGAPSFRDTYRAYLEGVRSVAELDKPGQNPFSHFALPVLAIQSGGLVLDEPSDIQNSFVHCIEDAETFYTLSFNPPDAAHPDEYHDLRVQLGEPGLAARTSTGYYDEPVFYDQPAVPVRQVGVQDLEQLLATANNERDDEFARKLEGLELRERFNSELLSLWKSRLHGKKSIAALVALADDSVFLAPPATEILTDPAPDPATQSRMIKQTAMYLRLVLSKLPDFFAVRTSTEYEQPQPLKGEWKTALADQSLHETVTEKSTLRYRNGQEEQDAVTKKGGQFNNRKKDFNLVGVFGPLLGLVFVDATRAQSILTWDHWARGEGGKKLAVFHYLVRAGNPHFDVSYCCLVGGETFLGSPRYLGELAIDPETGAILRLTMQAELGPILQPNMTPVRPADGAGIMVEYGPVQIGGREYICPQRSASMMRVRTVRAVTVWNQNFEVYGPYETRLDDSVYTGYHKFGADVHMLPGFDAAPTAAKSPTTGSQSTPNR